MPASTPRKANSVLAAAMFVVAAFIGARVFAEDKPARPALVYEVDGFT